MPTTQVRIQKKIKTGFAQIGKIALIGNCFNYNLTIYAMI